MAEEKRVDSVKVHKSGSRRFTELSGGKNQATFYDLTVANHPSFYANGNLVHNCVDEQMSSDYNSDVYTKIKVNNEMVLEYNDDILGLIDFPQSHLSYKDIWMGMDVGYTNDPSEILIFAEEKGKKKDDPSTLRLLSRVAMQRINHENQVRAILWLIMFYKPHVFAMDKTGLGLPLFQDIQERARKDANIKSIQDHIKGYNFSEKLLVDIDDSVKVEEFRGDVVKEAGVYRNVLEYSTDILRELVDSKRLILPMDKEIISEFQGQTFSYDKAVMDLYGRSRNFSKGTFHTLDAARMMATGWKQHKIDQFVAEKDKYSPVSPIFM